jgi:uncharacterized protein (TIGR02145 family)
MNKTVSLIKKSATMKSRIFLTTLLVLFLSASCDLYEDIFDNKEDKAGSVTDVDGNVYPTVTIGNQVWMAQNLKTTKYLDSTVIYSTTCPTIWASLTKGAYCWYNNDGKNKATYGALYNWYAVKTGKLCPAGWHVPTKEEWTKLLTFIGEGAENKMKETGTTHWISSNTGVTNQSGFLGLPGGGRSTKGSFDWIGKIGCWWSSTETCSTRAWDQHLVHDNMLTVIFSDKYFGYSIRCIKD